MNIFRELNSRLSTFVQSYSVAPTEEKQPKALHLAKALDARIELYRKNSTKIYSKSSENSTLAELDAIFVDYTNLTNHPKCDPNKKKIKPVIERINSFMRGVENLKCSAMADTMHIVFNHLPKEARKNLALTSHALADFVYSTIRPTLLKKYTTEQDFDKVPLEKLLVCLQPIDINLPHLNCDIPFLSLVANACLKQLSEKKDFEKFTEVLALDFADHAIIPLHLIDDNRLIKLCDTLETLKNLHILDVHGSLEASKSISIAVNTSTIFRDFPDCIRHLKLQNLALSEEGLILLRNLQNLEVFELSKVYRLFPIGDKIIPPTNVKELRLSEQPLSEIQFEAHQNIRCLNFSSVNLAQCVGLPPSLEKAYFHSSLIDDNFISTRCAPLQSLHTLIFEGPPGRNFHGETLDQLPESLTTLTIKDTRSLTQTGFRKYLERQKKAKIELTETKIDLKILLKDLPETTLQSVKIEFFKQPEYQVIEALSNQTGLEHIEIRVSNGTFLGKAVNKLPASLKSLHLKESPLAFNFMKMDLTNFPHLTELNCGGRIFFNLLGKLPASLRTIQLDKDFQMFLFAAPKDRKQITQNISELPRLDSFQISYPVRENTLDDYEYEIFEAIIKGLPTRLKHFFLPYVSHASLSNALKNLQDKDLKSLSIYAPKIGEEAELMTLPSTLECLEVRCDGLSSEIIQSIDISNLPPKLTVLKVYASNRSEKCRQIEINMSNKTFLEALNEADAHLDKIEKSLESSRQF